MNASELRIGNLVNMKSVYERFHDGTEVEVFKSGAYTVASLHSDNTLRLDCKSKFCDTIGCFDARRVEGIPLTEDWLLMFGFKLADPKHCYIRGMLAISKKAPFGLSVFGKVVSIRKDKVKFAGRWADIEPTIEYVHQLQNLYFALTGEELTIKPE